MRGSTSHIAVRFAAISIAVLTAVAGLAAYGGAQWVRANEDAAAARTADQLVGTAIRARLNALSPAASNVVLPPESRQELDSVALPLVSGPLRGLRLWTADGQVAWEAGTTADARATRVDGNGIVSTRLRDADGAPMLGTYSAANGYVLEIAQDARPIDDRIASAQRLVWVVVTLAYVALAALLQGGFWLVTRRLGSEHRRLVRLFASGEELRSSLDLHEVITQVARTATATAHGDFSMVALFEAETGDLLLRATYDASTDAISHHQRAVEDWFLRRAVITNSTIVSGQSAKAYEQFFGAELEKHQQINSLISPMALRERVVGVVAILRVPTSRHAAFNADDIRRTSDLAAQAAVAVEQAMLFVKVRSYAREVELSYDATLKAMIAALDAKDEVTEGHCERVAKMTTHLARHMGMPEAALVDMERGALLHDVGKIGVPDAVLKKPAALNDMEWEAMRKHPLLAGMMVSKVGFLEGATPILLYHHERYDGGGYPFGLAEEKIPLEARIFSVIDAYDAMTSPRPYRDAMTHEQAMLELESGSGTQFDPKVVEAFTRLLSTRPDLRSAAGALAERPAHHAADALPYEADDAA